MRTLALALSITIVVPLAGAAQARQAGSTTAQLDPKEWEVPWGASTRPRDPYPDANGKVWFVGQEGNYVANFDTKTSQFKRFEIDPGTNPHNLVVHDGVVWFTGNRNNRIVKLDPATGHLTTYRIPDSTVRDPHTITFDKAGIAWFTAQNAGQVGRFDPATGQFKLWKLAPRSRPYGIVLDSKGTIYFDEFGANRIGTIDPKTLELKEFTLPDAKALPRRIAVTSDDGVWYGDYGRGFLGHLDPRTGKVEEFGMPSGGTSLPYAMASDDRDVVWLAETGVFPNKLVAFDTKTRKWVESIPIGTDKPNVIRHMVFDKSTRQIWFGTDQGMLGRIKVPPHPVVP